MTIVEFVTNYNETIRENHPLPTYLVLEHMSDVTKMFVEYCQEVPNFEINAYGQIILLDSYEM